MTSGDPEPRGAPAPGWYPDPSGQFAHRYWDGTSWTGYVDVEGRTAWSPPGATRPTPPVGTVRRPRSTAGLAAALGVVLGVAAGALGALVLALAHRIAVSVIWERWNESRDPSPLYRRLDLADGLVTGVEIVLGLLTIAVLALLATWMWRIAANARDAGRWRSRLAPGWAIGGWFVPLASLVLPCTVTRACWRATEPTDGTPSTRESGRVVGWWWGTWVAGLLLVSLGGKVDTRTATSYLELRVSDTVEAAGAGVLLAAALLLRVVVRRITDRQRSLAAA
ncbi:MAG: DUF4328 domain-containing protein [Actinomycetes bacterium]